MIARPARSSSSTLWAQKRDLILSREGRTYNEDWDCIWEAKGHRDDKGWSVEVAIPF